MSKTLKAKLSAQLNKIEEIDSQNFAQESCVVVQETNPLLVRINTPVPTNAQLLQIVPEFAITLQEAKGRLEMLQQFVRDFMIPGVDFGLIPNCPRPSLLKSGAEKLCDVYGFSKHVEVMNRCEDWEKGFLHYEIKVILLNKKTNLVEAEGIGSANSRERKYAKQDPYSLSNTLLKMAKKRALVDAVLSSTRSSGIFTQDIEELNFEADPTKAYSKPVVSAPLSTKVDSTIDKLVTKDQLKLMYALTIEKGITNEMARAMLMARYKVKESKALTAEEAHDFLLFLQNQQASHPIKKAT